MSILTATLLSLDVYKRQPYDELQDLMGEIRRYGTIVFYCDRGAKSMVVCRDLWRMGYHAVDLALSLIHICRDSVQGGGRHD